jgi:hypothetical protein
LLFFFSFLLLVAAEKDFYSASSSSDTILNITVLSELSNSDSEGLYYSVRTHHVFKGAVPANTNLKLSVPPLNFFCAIGALALNTSYLVAGNYYPSEIHSEAEFRLSQCGNFTLYSRALQDSRLMDFLANYYNWATASCASGHPVVCPEDPCRAARRCDIPNAVCVATVCNQCEALFWSGPSRVCYQ